jgi:hypothetical protein
MAFMVKIMKMCKAWWYTPVIPILRRPRKIGLGYVVSSRPD